MSEVVSVVLMAAKNTHDGNPQRIYVGYDDHGRAVGIVDWPNQHETDWLDEWRAENGEPPEKQISVSQYRIWLSNGQQMSR